MTKKTAKEHDLITAAREVLAHRRGEITLNSYTVAVPQSPDVAALRKKLGYSQKQFADRFGFALSALKEWEQGRRTPERSARIFLTVIAANPEIIERTLSQATV